jgi:glycosyltransferase involved in cell wall biosynthesis
MVRPLVSVLLPVRDGARTLEAAARSVLRQTWSALELWIIDDGSKDGSAAVAQALEREDGRVRVAGSGGWWRRWSWGGRGARASWWPGWTPMTSHCRPP